MELDIVLRSGLVRLNLAVLRHVVFYELHVDPNAFEILVDERRADLHNDVRLDKDAQRLTRVVRFFQPRLCSLSVVGKVTFTAHALLYVIEVWVGRHGACLAERAVGGVGTGSGIDGAGDGAAEVFVRAGT